MSKGNRPRLNWVLQQTNTREHHKKSASFIGTYCYISFLMQTSEHFGKLFVGELNPENNESVSLQIAERIYHLLPYKFYKNITAPVLQDLLDSDTYKIDGSFLIYPKMIKNKNKIMKEMQEAI